MNIGTSSRATYMNRVLSAWMVVGALLLVSTSSAAAPPPPAAAPPAPVAASSSSSSGGVCVSETAKNALSACPGGPQLKPVQGKQPQMSFHSKVEDLKKGTKTIGIGTADVAMLAGMRDQRQSALKQRVLALLITEIQQLESLFKSTDARSKDRPMLLRRMAEDYVELENAAFRERTEAEVKRDNFKTSNPREAGKQQAIANSRKTTMDRSRKAAIANYTMLVNDYSGQPSQTFATNPPPAYQQLDEVYY